MTLASIDDLLQHEEEPPPKQRRAAPGLRRWVIQTILIAAALTAVAVFGMRMNGVTAPYPLVFAGFLALLALRRVLRDVAPPTAARSHGRRVLHGDDPSAWPTPDHVLLVLNRWETRLDWSKTDAAHFSRTVQLPMRDILDERLRQRHGITRESDPRRVQEIVDEALWRFIDTPAHRSPTPRELAALIRAMEQI